MSATVPCVNPETCGVKFHITGSKQHQNCVRNAPLTSRSKSSLPVNVSPQKDDTKAQLAIQNQQMKQGREEVAKLYQNSDVYQSEDKIFSLGNQEYVCFPERMYNGDFTQRGFRLVSTMPNGVVCEDIFWVSLPEGKCVEDKGISRTIAYQKDDIRFYLQADPVGYGYIAVGDSDVLGVKNGVTDEISSPVDTEEETVEWLKQFLPIGN